MKSSHYDTDSIRALVDAARSKGFYGGKIEEAKLAVSKRDTELKAMEYRRYVLGGHLE